MQPTIISDHPTFQVIDKPAGFSVEASDRYPSIEDWLKNDTKPAFTVHRIDVETSGLVLVAKSNAAKEQLQSLWQGRAVQKTYLALVSGETPGEGTIEQAIERDNKNDRQKVVLLPSAKSRTAITSYRRLAVGTVPSSGAGDRREEKISLVECHPITGRTHQIRVHLQYLGHPILGDKLYGNKKSEQLSRDLGIQRHMLHAWKLKLPETEEFVAKLPEDLETILAKLQIGL